MVDRDLLLGWIGTGVMGSSMCGHLIDAGYKVKVYSRSIEKARSLVERGAVACDSPGQAAAGCDFVFSMVGLPSDVEAVYLGANGIIKNAKAGAIVVDMTTSEPALAVKVHEAARLLNVGALDAPVSGGDIGARQATLSIMVGGNREIFERTKPLFEILGKTIIHQGEAGSGQHTKMVNQILIATGMIGVCEALLYGYRAGLDLNVVLQSVQGGAAGSWSLTNYAPRMLAGNFDPGFMVEHFIKDMGIALVEARRMNLSLPGLALAQQLYIALEAQGHGRKGTHSLLLALASLSALDAGNLTAARV